MKPLHVFLLILAMVLFTAAGFLVAGWMFLGLDLWWATGCFIAGLVSVGVALDRMDLHLHESDSRADQAQRSYRRAARDADDLRSKLVRAQETLSRARLAN